MARDSEDCGAALYNVGAGLFQPQVLGEVREARNRNSAPKRSTHKRSQSDWDAEAERLKAAIIEQGGIPNYCPLRAARTAQDILRRLGEL